MRSTARIKGHPIHPILVAFPVAFGTSAPVLDLIGTLGDWPIVWFDRPILASQRAPLLRVSRVQKGDGVVLATESPQSRAGYQRR